MMVHYHANHPKYSQQVEFMSFQVTLHSYLSKQKKTSGFKRPNTNSKQPKKSKPTMKIKTPAPPNKVPTLTQAITPTKTPVQSKKMPISNQTVIPEKAPPMMSTPTHMATTEKPPTNPIKTKAPKPEKVTPKKTAAATIVLEKAQFSPTTTMTTPSGVAASEVPIIATSLPAPASGPPPLAPFAFLWNQLSDAEKAVLREEDAMKEEAKAKPKASPPPVAWSGH